ncbi:MAG: stealth family protein [Opitutaceae bacterium]
MRHTFGGIDAVYTWVYGADPEFQQKLEHYRKMEALPGDPFVAGARRFRDSDELRYSLRSLETNAPWINRVFLVTNGQVPRWLKKDHPRLRLVTHREIFPQSDHLPTFNSAAIEAHLHRIPGLSRRFLYLNDDVFFGSPVAREDFLPRSGRQKIWVEPWTLPQSLTEGNLVSRWLGYNHHLLEAAFAGRTFPSLAHTPVLFDRVMIDDLQAKWPVEFERTSAMRFRTDKMVLLHVLYAHFHAARNGCELATVNADDYQFVMFDPPLEKSIDKLATVKRLRPKFFCINDDWDGDGQIKDTVLTEFFENYFPVPSSFERDP